MIFEPLKVIRSALDFYISSGIVDNNPEPFTVNVSSAAEVDGDRQKFEQIMLFLLGHLLPDYAPLTINLEARNNTFRTSIQLPQASSSSYYRLFDNVAQDDRLAKLTETSHAKLRTSLEPALMFLDFPISESQAPSETPILDRAALRHRFETLGNAATMIEAYTNNGRRHLSLLQQNLESGNVDESLRHLLALRNGAVHIFAQTIKNTCNELELTLKQNPNADSSPIVHRLEQELSLLSHYFLENKELFHG